MGQEKSKAIAADEETEELKKRIDLVDFIEKDGVELWGSGHTLSGVCPFHVDDKPSLRVYVSQQTWWCFACNFGGDIVSWVMRREDCRPKEAFQKLKSGNLGPIIVRHVHKPVMPYHYNPIPHALVEELHECLLHNGPMMKYCEDRFWSREIIDTYWIGYNEQTRRIAIPVHHPLGSYWVDIRMYAPHPTKNGTKVLPIQPGKPPLPYDVGGSDHPDYCILAEGEPDALAAASIGLPVATNTSGAGSAVRVWDQWSGIITAPLVLICYDNDEAGFQAAERVCKSFPDKAKIISFKSDLPKGFDITDAIRRYGPEQTRKLFERHVYE